MKHRCTLECSRRAVAQAGPYRVVSCADDTYRVERERATASLGVLAQLQLAEDLAAVLNARRPRG